jgi:5-histidylcysteine sulfoxide synthase/putative 4-mercaptohistidine N1-methyltranferase
LQEHFCYNTPILKKGFVLREISIYPPTLEGSDVAEKRREIREYFHNTYDLFEKMFEILKSDEVFYRKSEPTRHPMIFYFGHTAAFFINKLILMQLIPERINPEFESIFAVGVDEMDWDDLSEARYKWPSVDAVRSYRDAVRTLVDSYICSVDFTLPITQESPMWIVLMGIEHERIHIETSSVLHRQMPLEYIKEEAVFATCQEFPPPPQNEMVQIGACQAVLGKEKNHNLYGWDNEYGIHKEELSPFAVSKYLVSNAEYLPFVAEGGYENERFWDEEGRKFLEITGAKHPPFWVEEEGTYRYRTLTKLIDMPLSWPVEVNALEAMAFCRYKSEKEGREYTLPSEAEFRALYEYAELGDVPELEDNYANINFNHTFSSCPVNKFMFRGLGDVIGNVWQWSRTPIFGFEGFEVHPAYDDFSTPTFDGKHAMICGASWASSGNLIMKHSRYAFRRHFYQHAGFRYAISSQNDRATLDVYESDELVSQYCEFHYGKGHFGVENFALACAALAQKFAVKTTKALDIGCATGRKTFELAKTFDTVEGIDFSVRFIGVGSKLKNEGYVAWHAKREGDLYDKRKRTLKELGYENLAEKVQFWQGDACNLKPNFTGYDMVLAAGLLERLYRPSLFLEEIASRINEGGILIVVSENKQEEDAATKEMLEKNFEMLHAQEVAFVTQESAGKIQHAIAEASVWRKR